MNIKKVLKVTFPLLLAIAFGWYIFSIIPFSNIIPYFKSANYYWIALGVGFGFVSHLSRAYRWNFLLEPLGHKIKFPNSVMAIFIAYLANYGIPRSGEVLRAVAITNYENIPFEKGFGTIVAERMADLIVMLLIISLTLILQFDFIYALLEKSFNPKSLIIMLLGSITLLAALLIYFKRSRSKLALKIKTFVKGLAEGVLSIFKMKRKWAFIVHTLFIWSMYVLMFYVTTFAIQDLNEITIGAVLIAFIAASFTIAATNSGVFFYPAAIMAAFLLFQLPKDASYAFGWIMWTSQTLMIAICGSLAFIILPIYNKKK